MKKWIYMIVCTLLICAGCGPQEVMVDSGNYEGSILKINPAENEIYVALDEKRVLELYFTETTTVSRGESKTTFDALVKGQSVRVQVERGDQEMVPVHVTILDQ
jgi:hypothetical protein